jgi:hypothetical protein
MPSTITATLERAKPANESEYNIIFYIRAQGDLYLDFIFIERKTKGKHRDKACWSVATHYKAQSIGDWLFKLEDFGFDTSEFEQACIEMGWEKEVEVYHNETRKKEE